MINRVVYYSCKLNSKQNSSHYLCSQKCQIRQCVNRSHRILAGIRGCRKTHKLSGYGEIFNGVHSNIAPKRCLLSQLEPEEFVLSLFGAVADCAAWSFQSTRSSNHQSLIESECRDKNARIPTESWRHMTAHSKEGCFPSRQPVSFAHNRWEQCAYFCRSRRAMDILLLEFSRQIFISANIIHEEIEAMQTGVEISRGRWKLKAGIGHAMVTQRKHRRQSMADD